MQGTVDSCFFTSDKGFEDGIFFNGQKWMIIFLHLTAQTC